VWRATYRALRKQFKIPVCCRVHIYVSYRGGVAHAPPYSRKALCFSVGQGVLCYCNVILFIDIGDDTEGIYFSFHGLTGMRGNRWDLCIYYPYPLKRLHTSTPPTPTTNRNARVVYLREQAFIVTRWAVQLSLSQNKSLQESLTKSEKTSCNPQSNRAIVNPSKATRQNAQG